MYAPSAASTFTGWLLKFSPSRTGADMPMAVSGVVSLL